MVEAEKMETSSTPAGALDMTLADIIKANKAKQKTNRGGKMRGRGGGRGRGIVKRGGQGGQRGGMRGKGNIRGGGQRGNMRGGMRGRGLGRGRGGIQLSTLRAKMNQGAPVPSGPAKLLISNLDKGVSDSDIFELFAEFGTINEAAVHYDRLGRSVSTAHVLFARHVDALKALKQYNGVNLDGRPMNMTIEAGGRGPMRGGLQGRGGSVQFNFNPGMGGGAVKRLQQSPRGMGIRGRGMRGGMRGRGRGGFPLNVNIGYGFNKNYNIGVGRGGNRGRGGRGRGMTRGGKRGGNRGGGRGAGRGGNRGAGRGGKKQMQQKKTPTVEELDAELDSYLNETA
ncbi:THO complex subunit 4-like [Macrobrachium rosenbergii]|uniref:THO complex subunit 4-like n=1 Tax=Macrobrachium rosenbergii TaxID=79674 RepID=UPI0034D4A183